MADDLNLFTLDRTTAMKVREICQQGYFLFDNGNFKSAIRQFYSAWTLLPKPQTQWEDAVNPFIYFRLGQCLFEPGALGLAGTHFQKVKGRGGAELLAKEHHKYKEFSPS